MRPIRLASLALLLLSGLSLMPIACGGPVKCYRVSGEVFLDGQPASGAEIMFYPVEDEKSPYKPSATVESDGSFRLTTYTAYDGAPAGEYKVTIVWRDGVREEGETHYGPDKFGNHYRSPKVTTLTATVEPKSNFLARFDLQSSAPIADAPARPSGRDRERR
jgi:hypothetical protein